MTIETELPAVKVIDPIYWMANDGTRDLIGHMGKINPTWDGQTWRDRFTIPLYAEPREPVAVKVKALEWRGDFAHTDIGMFYMISPYNGGAILEKCRGSSTMKSVWPSEDEAKAAAQADYESRIRSALIPEKKEG